MKYRIEGLKSGKQNKGIILWPYIPIVEAKGFTPNLVKLWRYYE